MSNFEKDLADGKEFEARFVDIMKEDYNINVIRADEDVLKNPDFQSNAFFECKKIREPFRMSMKYVGLEPEKSIPLDVAKLKKYKSKCHPVFLMIDVDFTPNYDTKGIYVLTVQKLRQLFRDHPERKFTRKSSDPTNNACVKFHISIDECIPIEELFG